MPLSDQEYDYMKRWTFLEAYERWRTELIELAKEVYLRVCREYNDHSAPDVEQVEIYFGMSLHQSDLWEDIITEIEESSDRRVPVSKALRKYSADAMSKYVLDKDWGAIEQPCPPETTQLSGHQDDRRIE